MLVGGSAATNWILDKTFNLGNISNWLLTTTLTTGPAFIACRWHTTVRAARSAGYANGYLRGIADRIEHDRTSY